MAQAVGITGHQNRPEIQWEWVRETLRRELTEFGPDFALSSLAVGSDQVFADEAQRLGLKLVAVIPLLGYDRYFRSEGLVEYRRLLALSEVVQLPGSPDEQAAFFEAGAYISDHADLMIAVWDENPSQGFGGTADVVKYRLSLGKTTVILNPIKLNRKKLF